MDKIDREILLTLQENCRISYEALARAQGLTANAVKRRILCLMDSGVIYRFKAQLSLAMIDAEWLLGLVTVKGPRNDEGFADQVGVHPIITSVGYDSYGTCLINAEYSGVKHLAELGKFLRGLSDVTDVELHPCPRNRGGKMELSKEHLKVLQALQENPRKPISVVASETSFTSRRVKKMIDEMDRSGAVEFTCEFDVNSSGSTRFVIRVTWDDRETSANDIIQWAQKEFEEEYWYTIVSASEPLLWAIFVSDHIRIAEQIQSGLRALPQVTPVITIVPYPPKRYKGLRDIKLAELFENME